MIQKNIFCATIEDKALKKLIKKITKKIKNAKWFNSFVGWFLCVYVRLVGKTTKFDMSGMKKFYDIWEKDGSLIMVAWHGRVGVLPYFWNKKRKLKALVSTHRDGQLIGKLLKSFGIGVIGGSSNNNASGAAISLMKTLKKNDSIAIIPDGPRGPSMKMTMSPIYYAQKTGKPIVGVGYSIKGAKLAKSWDSMMLPPLFSKGITFATDPFYIPKDAKKEELEKYRLQIEKKLNDIMHDADKKLGVPYVEAGKEAKKKHEKK